MSSPTSSQAISRTSTATSLYESFKSLVETLFGSRSADSVANSEFTAFSRGLEPKWMEKPLAGRLSPSVLAEPDYGFDQARWQFRSDMENVFVVDDESSGEHDWQPGTEEFKSLEKETLELVFSQKDIELHEDWKTRLAQVAKAELIFPLSLQCYSDHTRIKEQWRVWGDVAWGGKENMLFGKWLLEYACILEAMVAAYDSELWKHAPPSEWEWKSVDKSRHGLWRWRSEQQD